MSNTAVGAVNGVKPTRYRWFLLGIIFTTCLIAYLDRVNISVCAPFVMEELKFDRVQLGFTMSAFFMGYLVMQIPGGLMAARWGIRKTGLIAMLWWSLFTMLTPAAWGFASFMAVRFMFGLGEGPLYPNNTSFFARWFNRKEMSLPSSLMMVGTFLGPALGPPLTVFILSQASWHWVFYIYGILGFIIAVVWYICSRDTPDQSSKVNAAELLHITEKTSVEEAVAAANEKVASPWPKFLVNIRFWCFGIQYFCTNYIIYIFLSWIPLYLLEAKGMSLTAMGGAAALPWLGVCLGMYLTGLTSDKWVNRGFSKFFARGVFGMIGLLGCGIFLYLATTVETTAANVACLTISAFLLGFNYTSSWTGCQDLGGRHGGIVGSWMNTWGTLGGVLAPIITAVLVGIIGWDSTLAVSCCVVVLGIICWLFVKPDQILPES